MYVDRPSSCSPRPIYSERHRGKTDSFDNTVLEESAGGKVEDQGVRKRKITI